MKTSYVMYPINPTQDQAWEAGRLQGLAFAERRDDAELAALIAQEEQEGNASTYVGAGFLAGLYEAYSLRVHAMPEPDRVLCVVRYGRNIASTSCGILWYLLNGYVWCVKSSTQCDYCGPAASWKMPQHAKAEGGAA